MNQAVARLLVGLELLRDQEPQEEHKKRAHNRVTTTFDTFQLRMAFRAPLNHALALRLKPPTPVRAFNLPCCAVVGM
jgi:hypothetical protein